MKKILVLGGGGFIGSHLVKKLREEENNFVKAVDLKKPSFSLSQAQEFLVGDLRSQSFCDKVFNQTYDEIYQ